MCNGKVSGGNFGTAGLTSHIKTLLKEPQPIAVLNSGTSRLMAYMRSFSTMVHTRSTSWTGDRVWQICIRA